MTGPPYHGIRTPEKLMLRYLVATTLLILGLPSAAQDPPAVRSFAASSTEIPPDGSVTLNWETSEASSVSINQGIGSVPINGTATVRPSRRQFLLPRGSEWRYLDDGMSPAAADWTSVGFDDADWPSGPAILGYGDPPATSLLFGGDESNRAISYYFRHTFEFSSDRFPADAAWFFELLRDDGAAIYLNGEEIYRSNLPEGPLDPTTLADVAVSNAGEATYFRQPFDPSLLVEGTNQLAVEVHQAGPTSSDLSFDFSLYAAVYGSDLPILPAGSEWAYLDDGSNPDPQWVSPDFDDTEWSRGPAELGYDDRTEATTLSFGDDPANKHITTYFRQTFDIDESLVAGFQAARIRLRFDDAVAIYINGVEVLRENLPEGELTSETLAVSPIDGDAEGTFTAFFIDQAILQAGTNLIAAEVHQLSPVSSDLAFDLQLETSDGVETSAHVLQGSTWRYLDDGSEPEATWRGFDFDDSSWPEGPALFGYGDSDPTIGFTPATTLRSGFPGEHAITTYFRTRLEVSEATLTEARSIEIQLKRDDGAVVYLNGEEVGRSNMPAGPVDFRTLASASAADNGLQFSTIIPIDEDQLLAGSNTLAVEVHQIDPTSSDLRFDLRVQAVQTALAAGPTTYRLTAENDSGDTDDAEVTIESTALPSEEIYLTTENGLGVDWNTGDVWSDGEPTHADARYVVLESLAGDLRTPALLNASFLSPLEIRGSASRLILQPDDNGLVAIPNLFLNNGTILQGLIGGTTELGGPDSELRNSGSSLLSFGGESGFLVISSSLTGDGLLTVGRPLNESPDAPTELRLTGSDSRFAGSWQIEGTLRAQSDQSLGQPTDITIAADGVLDLDYSLAGSNPTLTLTDSGILILDQTITVGE
ncbi:MAG: hypothetical protein AAF514_09385, partial [Verrucomicrobiota bacterium]